MSDWIDKVLAVGFCLGGINPLCATGCSSDEEIDADCYDDEKLKSSEDLFKRCKKAVCSAGRDTHSGGASELENEWRSTCGYYNFNEMCFAACNADEIESREIRGYRELYGKLCLGDGRNIRTEWENPRIFTSPPEHFEKPEWCSFDPTAEENSWIPQEPFGPEDAEEFARFLMEDLGWEIRVGVYQNSNEESGMRDRGADGGGVSGVRGVELDTPREVTHELSWRGALPESGLETIPQNCGLLCALMNSINLLIERPHLLKLLKNPQGHRFVFFAGTIPNPGPMGFVHWENEVEASIFSVDADKIMKFYRCARGNNVSEEEVNEFVSFVISHEFGHIYQSPPDTANIPLVYEQLGSDYFYLFLDAAFRVYKLSPTLGRGDGISHSAGGVGFVSGYDQVNGAESFAEEAAFYLHFRNLFEEYAREDAASGDYFLMKKFLLLGERLYCEDVDMNP